MKGKRYFIVEVKSMGLDLSPKHLRQAVNYAANEGIEWALLTNARCFDFYKILFSKPIDSRKIFSIDLADKDQLKSAADQLQYLTKTLLPQRGLDSLWHKHSALDPSNVSKLFYSKPIVNFLRRQLRKAYRTKFSEDEIRSVITRVIEEQVEAGKTRRPRSRRRQRKGKSESDSTVSPQLATN
jgi:hypothetical protein